MRKILYIPLFAVLITVLSLLPQDAHAVVTIDLKDQASCQAAPLSGTWTAANSTCRIGSLTLNSGDSLTVDASVYSNISLTTTGSFTNFGTITNYGTVNNKGSFYNQATIDNYHIITNYGIFYNNGGTINNYSGGIINNNHGQIRNTAGATLNNFGTINNRRLITNESGSAINNNGKIKDYCGSTFTNNGTLTGNQVINKCDPTNTTISPNPSFTALSSTKKFNAIVTDTSSPPSTPTGTVSWSDGGAGGKFSSASCTLVSSSSSSSTCSIVYSPPSKTGPVSITATYSGDGTHGTSSGTSALTVILRHTSTVVTPNPSSVVHGSPITYLSTLADTSGGTKSAPTGTVSWNDGGAGGSFSTSTCTLVATSSSQSQCSVTYTLTAGSVTITANYLGDTIHKNSSGTSVPPPTISSLYPISYSNPIPSPQTITQFFTVVPVNETGFQAGENVTTTYTFPNGTCSTTQKADSSGKISTDSPACPQGSANYTGGYIGYGAHEGKSYNVTATGQTSGLSATTTFVPTLTNGSSWNTGNPCNNNCSTPRVVHSTLHLVYFNPQEDANSTYTPIINAVLNSHNAIVKYSETSGFDYASSFRIPNLNAYPGNITRILLEYNDTTNGTKNVATTNGIQQGINQAISQGWKWVGYDDECNNAGASSPNIEMIYKANWSSAGGPEALCKSGSSVYNASAIGNYTNLASSLVKAKGLNFTWAGQISAMIANYTPGRPVYQYVNWNNIDMVVIQLQGPAYSNSPTKFNSTIAQISAVVRAHHPNTLIIVQTNPGLIGSCSCIIGKSQLTYDYQYSRFQGGTPTKWMYDGAGMVISTTTPPDVDVFIRYLGR